MEAPVPLIRRRHRGQNSVVRLGRVQSVEIPVKLIFYLLDPVKFDPSLRDFGISITLFQHRDRGRLQVLLLSFAIARKNLP
jgi:hypothetical protein